MLQDNIYIPANKIHMISSIYIKHELTAHIIIIICPHNIIIKVCSDHLRVLNHGSSSSGSDRSFSKVAHRDLFCK